MFEGAKTDEAMRAAMPAVAVMSDDEIVSRTDELHVLVSRGQRDLFALLREIGRREVWRADGAQSLAHWICMRYGISAWKAERWVAAAEALESLPCVSRAFSLGHLGIDKVVEPPGSRPQRPNEA